jgi:hypothetical protein
MPGYDHSVPPGRIALSHGSQAVNCQVAFADYGAPEVADLARLIAADRDVGLAESDHVHSVPSSVAVLAMVDRPGRSHSATP